MKDLRVGFVMSTEVGWRTQFLNWQRCLSDGHGVEPEWIVISWWNPDGWMERMPGVPAGVKARVRSRIELYRGLTKGPFDALYVSVGHTLHGAKPFLSRQPYFIATDVTPLQLHAFGDIYGITRTRFDWFERFKHRGWQERYRGAAALFACSHWAAESMAVDYGAARERIHVIPPGIDLAQWEFAAREQRARPAQVLFVGGDFRRKGGDLLLDWARNTSARDWVLHLVTRDHVGNGDPRIKVYNHLTANDPELRQLYRQADVFVLPTRGDCYSIASIEAMASGAPVILSRTGGTGDILREGETGHLIAPGDGRALAARLEALLADAGARERMGRAARADVEARFDARKNIERTIALMRAHMRGSSGRPAAGP